MPRPIDVEVNLAIPRIKNPILGQNGYPIDNGTVRFTKIISVPAIPQPGALLQLSTSAGHEFSCTVTRAEWSEDRSMFVLSCKYSNRSIPHDQCAALFNDPEWKMKQLLE
jgi:hypothetical protein